MAVLARVVVGSKEDELMTELKPVVMSDEVVKGVVGVDGGSTQTRVQFVEESVLQSTNVANWFTTGAVIPSISKCVSKDARFNTRTKALYDNMDATISINGGEPLRIVRGSRLLDSPNAVNELVLSTKKIRSDVLLYNIIDSIGYMMLERALIKDLPVPKKMQFDLAIAVPPDDLAGEDAENFSKTLKSFSWHHMSLPFPIEVVVTKVKLLSEPEAQCQGYYYLSKDSEMPERVILLECGGRNSAPAVFINGAVAGDNVTALDVSGAKTLTRLGLLLMHKFSIQMPQAGILERAMETGKFQLGNQEKDISDIVIALKKEIGIELFTKFKTEVLSRQSNVSLLDLHEVLLAGRTLGKGTYDYSIADSFMEQMLLEPYHPSVTVLDGNLIPQAAILACLV